MTRRLVPIDELRVLAAEGRNSRQCADALGFGIKGILGASRRHGIAVQRPPVHSPWDGLDDELRRLAAQNMSAEQIAEIFGTSRNAVIGRLYRTGIKLHAPRKPRPPALPRPVQEVPAVVFPGAGNCVFPSGDPRQDGFTFCRQRTGSMLVPYCQHHMRLAYLATRPKLVLAA